MLISNSILNEKIDNEDIFEKYKNILDELKEILFYSDKKVMKLEFQSDVEFLHPLFLIQVYSLYELMIREEIDKRILIDLHNLEENVQHWSLSYLGQYIEYQIIFLENNKNNFNKDVYLNYFKKIVVFYSVKHTDYILTSKKKYSFLPITKITELTKINMDTDYLNFEDKNNFKHIYYKQLQLETKEEGIYREKSDNVWTDIFEIYLNLAKDKTDSMYAFKNILFECVDNIQKHTQHDDEKANGYIAFYKNRKNKMNEFIISDDYSKGFLETYLEVLRTEKSRLTTIYMDKLESHKITDNEEEEFKKIISNYSTDIKLLEGDTSSEEEEVLEELFCIDKIPKMHQAGRMIMHFGIPTLMKLLDKLSHDKSRLDIYLHRKERSYCINYKKGKATVRKLDDNTIQGTYIYLSFPFNSEIPKLDNLSKFSLKSKDFRTMFENKVEIKKRVDLFEENIIDINDFENKEIDSKTISFKYINENVSDFLRKIYLCAYMNDIEDILIYNFPIKKYKNYLNILIDIFYPNEDTKYHSQTFVAFLNIESPQSLVIGGNDKTELLSINKMLSKNYNYNNENYIISNINDTNELLSVQSNLFYKTDKCINFLPFELFYGEGLSKHLFMNMVQNFFLTEEGYIDIHLDTGDKFHLKKFYNIKSIFEDSFWINRIAFTLASQIETNSENIIFVGSWYYSTQIISVARSMLSNNNDYFIIYNYDDDLERFKKFVKKPLNKEKTYVFFAPVVLSGEKIDKYIDCVEKSNNYCGIQLFHTKMKNDYNRFEFFLKKDISDIVMHSEDCEYCYDMETPLYQLDKNTFNIKDLFIKEYNTKISKIDNTISWENSINFGHVERGNNHYLYYTKTISFLKENKEKISNYLSSIKNEIIGTKINIILVPMNETNPEFITLVDNVVFNNDTIIHYFDIQNKEQNLNTIEHLREKYKSSKDYKFYFIDDEISSGTTLEYFYTILNYIQDKKTSRFSGVFSLLDRISEEVYDLKNYYKKLYTFKKLPIKPIKTNLESCYLCERENYFTQLVYNSSLVFIKEQFRTGAKKLKITDATYVEYKEFNDFSNIKNYLKVAAVEYVYINFKEIKDEHSIESELDNFNKDMKVYYKNIYGDIKINSIIKILDFEIRIAFIKALSFPKILFYKKIRSSIHKFILKELKRIRNDLIGIKDGEIIRKDSSIKIEKFLSEGESVNLAKSFPEILIEYNSKTNIDYLNFLMITSSYLKINFILSYEMLLFYYLLTIKIKNEGWEHSLMHKYPIAVKMLVSYSSSKSKYFNKQLSIFISTLEYDFKYVQRFSLIFPLIIENNNYYESLKTLSIDELVKNDKSYNENLKKLNLFMRDFIKISQNIQLLININFDDDNIKLIDIFDDNFKLVRDKDSREGILFKGAISKKGNLSDPIELEENKDTINEYNIWSNYYVENKEDSRTYIRLTKVEKSKICSEDNIYKPLCVVVIKHNSGLNDHLKLSRNILLIQENIIDFMLDNNLIKVLKEKYQNINLENKELEMYKKLLGNIKHSSKSIYEQLADYVIDNKTNKELLSIYHFTVTTEYKNLANLLEIENTEKKDYQLVKNSMDGSFLNELNNYFKSINVIMKENIEINITNDIEDKFKLGLTKRILRAMFFELIDNVYYNKEKKARKVNILFTCLNGELYIINNNTVPVPNENIKKIFDLAYTTTGTGSGLYFIKKILNQNKISIEYIDKIPNQINFGYDISFALKIKG